MFALTLSIPPGNRSALSVPVDVDGDGVVGPHEAIDLSRSWKGPAGNPHGGEQFWRRDNGSDIYYEAGRVGVGSATPNHQLRVSGGPSWTSNQWSGSLEMDNGSAIAWNQNAAGQHFGIGQTTGGLYFFRSLSQPGLVDNPANYIMAITDAGRVGIGTSEPPFPLTIQSFGYGLVHTDGEHQIGTYVNLSGGWLGTRSNHPLHLFANDSAPRVTLSTEGSLGVGTTTPQTTVRLHALHNASGATAIRGEAPSGNGVVGVSTAPGFGATAGVNTGMDGIGVYGEAHAGGGSYGVLGTSNQGAGVRGVGNRGVVGRGTEIAVQAVADGNGIGLVAIGAGGSPAAQFNGSVTVNGTLTKIGGNFRIDHPLDPANKYLSHSFVESPDMMNIYNGNVFLDENGEAEIHLPDWFMALNKDFRYQLTPIGGPGPNLFIARKITDGKFRIDGGAPGLEVSWQVTGVRQDVWAEANRIKVEEEKPAKHRGKYLVPELYREPVEKGIHYSVIPPKSGSLLPPTTP